MFIKLSNISQLRIRPSKNVFFQRSVATSAAEYTFSVLRRNSAVGWRFVSTEIKGTGKNGEVTQMDILKWREGKNKLVREIEFGGQKQKWNYRSELVKRRGLDNDHKYIWMAFGGLIIIGFTAFVAVKTSVIENRRQAMIEREQMRKMLHLEGEDRKKIGVV